MSSNVEQALANVIQAMQRLNQQFEDKIEEMRKQGRDEAELQQLVKGALAMKDASGIYLSWANHYIERLNQTDGDRDDDESMIVEK